MNGDNSVESGHIQWPWSQATILKKMVTTPVLKPQIKRNIVTSGENVKRYSAYRESLESLAMRWCQIRSGDSIIVAVISRADLKMNGGSTTTNGISHGAYATVKTSDYVVLETVAEVMQLLFSTR